MSTLLDRANKILSNLEAKENIVQTQHVTRNGLHVVLHRNDGKLLAYNPEPTAILYHTDKSRGKHVMGPYSSGKSVMCLFDCLLDSMDMPECMDGIRRSRTCVMRTTYNELQSTTIKTFLDWFGDFGYPPPGKVKTFIKMPYPTFHVRFYDGKGIVDWEVLFLAFEREEHVKKLGSLEVTNAYFNETRDFPEAIYDAASGRISRYPKQIEIGDQPYYASLKSDTNPPDSDHWLYDRFEKTKPKSYRKFQQPPAVIEDKTSDTGWRVNPDADNIKYNASGYYETLPIGKSREFIRVFCEGLYGSAVDGKKVFEEYNDDFHSIENIEYVESEPLYLGWDFGLTPCLVISQFIGGQLRVIKEFITKNMGIENLIQEEVKPYWAANRMDRFTIGYSDADPAGGARSAKNIFEPTLIEVITEQFKPTVAALTNDVDMRLEAVRHYMNRMAAGKPSFIVSRSGCPILRKGFNGHYVLKSVHIAGKGEKMYEKVPAKTHPISEPQDCLQYIAVRLHKSGENDTKYNAEICKSFMNHGRIP